jgi:PIN domain nuclease of toxin-antitoxin system
VILLDTHALLWWALDPVKLSETARAWCDRIEVDGGFASAISIWEIGVKVKRGKLELGISTVELARRIAEGSAVEIISVDWPAWLRSVELPWEHRDPADRVIVATAQLRGIPILTQDAQMHAFTGANIW